MGTKINPNQPELFLPDEQATSGLTINPEALAPQALAKRAFDMAPVAAERDRLRAEAEADAARAAILREERESDNPHYHPIDPVELKDSKRQFESKRPTSAEAKANAAKYVRQSRHKRWGR